MVGLLEQIQRGALEPTTKVSALLRMVKFAAAKLKLDQLEAWVDHELKGYGEQDTVPEYRKPKGVPFGEATDGSHKPITIQGASDWWTTVVLGEPIAALEHSVAEGSSSFYRPYPPSIVESLNNANRGEIAQAGVQFSSAAMVKVIDTVRTLILEWALEMERAGITGDGMSFSDDEKKKAAINIGVINNMTGVIATGNVVGNLIASPFSLDRVRSLSLQLAAHTDALVAEGANRAELDQLRRELETELAKEHPDHGMIATTLETISDKLKTLASGVVAQGVIAIISGILGLPASYG